MNTPDQFHDLTFYTLAHPDQIYFIHQHVVDAYFAQQADLSSKPIGILFSLVGLYLYLEHGRTGRQVQQAHMQLAKDKSSLPAIIIPQDKGSVFLADVLAAAPGEPRDELIRVWCATVWEAYSESHHAVASYVRQRLHI